MKNSFNYLTKWGLSLFILLLAAGVWCQNLYSQDRDIWSEVLVYILPDSLELPTGEVRDVSPDRALIQSEGLSQALQQLPVQALDRAFPELTDADTIRVREDGVSVKLPQWSRVFIVRLDSRQAVGEALETLGDEPSVLFAEPHSDMRLDDHLFAQQWHLNNTGQNFGTPGADIDALDAWNIFTGSSLVRLAIVDTGVETNHVDLSGKASGDQPDVHPFQPYGHGTHVAGKMMRDNQSVAYITDSENNYYGTVTKEDLIAPLSSLLNLTKPGSVIIVELPERDYALSDIVRVIELEGIKILGIGVQSVGEDKKTYHVSIKLNDFEIYKVLHVLNRYGYVIVSETATEHSETDLHERADELMRYLSI